MIIKAFVLALGLSALVAGCASTDTAPTAQQVSAAEKRAQEEAEADAERQALIEAAAAADNKRVVSVVGDDGRDPDAMRCKRTAKTGSRVKKKVCATNREWAISERRGREMTEDYQRNSAYGREADKGDGP